MPHREVPGDPKPQIDPRLNPLERSTSFLKEQYHDARTEAEDSAPSGAADCQPASPGAKRCRRARQQTAVNQPPASNTADTERSIQGISSDRHTFRWPRPPWLERRAATSSSPPTYYRPVDRREGTPATSTRSWRHVSAAETALLQAVQRSADAMPTLLTSRTRQRIRMRADRRRRGWARFRRQALPRGSARTPASSDGGSLPHGTPCRRGTAQ